MNNFKLLLISTISLFLVNSNFVNSMDTKISNINSIINTDNIKQSEVSEFINNVKDSKEVMKYNIKLQLNSLTLEKSNCSNWLIENDVNKIYNALIGVIEDTINGKNDNYMQLVKEYKALEDKYKKLEKENKESNEALENLKEKLHDQGVMKMLYLSINYYLYNIESYFPDNIEKFNTNSNTFLIQWLQNVDMEQFNQNINLLKNYQVYSCLNKIIKGINSLKESINKSNNQNSIIKNKVIQLSNGYNKCFLVSAVQQFIGMLRQSDLNSGIRKTNFALFIKYIEDIYIKNYKKIDIIQELKKFVSENKRLFNTQSQQEVLNCLFAQEREQQSSSGTAGMLGDMFILKIFPELQKYIGGNKMEKNDVLLDATNNFSFNFGRNIDIHKKFDESTYSGALVNMEGIPVRYPFSNDKEFIISILHGKRIEEVIKNREYISFYNEEGILHKYKLIGMQLRTEIGRTGHYVAYVKQNKCNDGWSYIDSISFHKDNKELKDITKLIDTSKHVVHQAVYKEIKE